MPLPDTAELTPIFESDLERVLAWRNSERIRTYMFSDHMISLEEHKAWFEKLKKEELPTFLIFRVKNEPIGIVSISQWDKRNRTCFWGFYIGKPDAPKGYGTFMGYLGLEYIFGKLKIRKVCGEVFAFNSAGIRFHQKLGFVEEGCFREHVLKNGKYEDVHCFGLLNSKWTELKPEIEKDCFKGIKG